MKLVKFFWLKLVDTMDLLSSFLIKVAATYKMSITLFSAIKIGQNTILCPLVVFLDIIIMYIGRGIELIEHHIFIFPFLT